MDITFQVQTNRANCKLPSLKRPHYYPHLDMGIADQLQTMVREAFKIIHNHGRMMAHGRGLAGQNMGFPEIH